MARRSKEVCPKTAAEVAAYLCRESLTDDEVQVGHAEVARWDRESAGWSPYVFETWANENAPGWPQVTYGGISSVRDDDETSWNVERSGDCLIVSDRWGEAEERVEDMVAAMAVIRARIVRSVPMAA